MAHTTHTHESPGTPQSTP